MRVPLPLFAPLLALALLAPRARAEDPPRLDVLALLDLDTREDLDGLASANSLPCTVGKDSPLEVFGAGEKVLLMSFGPGRFRVVPDTNVLACAVGEWVHFLHFLSPRRALVGLGLEPTDEPLERGKHLSTRVADPARLRAHGISCDGKGDLVSVYDKGSGRWSISTFGEQHGFAEVDAWSFYMPRAPLGELLERATVVLDVQTLVAGGRLLARVDDPSRLAALGIRQMPAGELVELEREAEGRWTLTTLASGFTCTRALDALDPEALGLAAPRLLDLPPGGTVRGRLTLASKAKQAGLPGLRSHRPVEVVRQEDGAYLLRDPGPRRPVSVPLPSPWA